MTWLINETRVFFGPGALFLNFLDGKILTFNIWEANWVKQNSCITFTNNKTENPLWKVPELL